jgi:hypothetical protein
MAAPNNPYPPLSRGIDPAIVRHIKQASQSSSTDFGLLMAQAKQESGFKPDAKAATGSASGLFQFVGSTWLDMMHRFGAKYGAGDLAQQITVDSAGKASVVDPDTRARILALRNDPQLSASLAGEYAKLNKTEVERALGHPIGRADLYMAHFLGAGGATTFLKALATKGNTAAADLLPDAAAANPGIFYDSTTGQKRSVAQIYGSLGSHIEADAQDFSGAASAEPTTNVASLAAIPQSTSSFARTDFAGLRLSSPVAALFDVMTEAALKLVASNDAPTSAHPRRSAQLD